jgi:hypothetical protein
MRPRDVCVASASQRATCRQQKCIVLSDIRTHSIECGCGHTRQSDLQPIVAANREPQKRMRCAVFAQDATCGKQEAQNSPFENPPQTASASTLQKPNRSATLARPIAQFLNDGTKPTIDLNLVYNPAADYQVTSPSNGNYKYHVNPCGQVSEHSYTCTH